MYKNILESVFTRNIEAVGNRADSIDAVTAFDLTTVFFNLSSGRFPLAAFQDFVGTEPAESLNQVWDETFLAFNQEFCREFLIGLKRTKDFFVLLSNQSASVEDKLTAARGIKDNARILGTMAESFHAKFPKQITDLEQLLVHEINLESPMHPLLLEHVVALLSTHWEQYQEAYRTMGAFMHDIRAKLAALGLFADLYPKVSEQEARQKAFTQIETTLRAINVAFGTILPSNVAEATTLKPVSTSEIAEALRQDVISPYQVLAVKKGQKLIFKNDIPGDTNLAVMAQVSHLKSIVDNLLSNALKYTPAYDGNRHPEYVPTIMVRLTSTMHSGLPRINISVSDNGPGVAREHRDLLFEPYYRVPGNQEKGQGVGLYFVKQLIEKLGGIIRMDTVSDEAMLGMSGTNFRISFNAYPSSDANSPSSREEFFKLKLAAREKANAPEEVITDQMSDDEWERLIRPFIEGIEGENKRA
jgi:signal transduction histidine kinase